MGYRLSVIWMACLQVALLAVQPLAAQEGLKAISGRWTEDKAHGWYAQQPWLVGANYLPRNAINQLEMWQKETFSPEIIDQEFSWAAAVGMNTMRVFLHDLAWKQDPQGFLDRIDAFLAIADRHRIRPMLVIFDDVWHPVPQMGPQPDPRPHLHNSGWVQSPGKAILGDPARHNELEPYVKAVLGRFAQDKRVLAWDLYNEPGNMVDNSYGRKGADIELHDKPRYSLMLLEKVFIWARAVNPSQPLTAGAWPAAGGVRRPLSDPDTLDSNDIATLHPLNQFMLANSDIISWHCYEPLGEFAADIRGLTALRRPLFLTEYLVRERGDNSNRFEYFLPIAKGFRVAMYNWGLVDGKSQTKYPWISWEQELTQAPVIWFHDVFKADGSPYDAEEVALIKRLTGRGATTHGH